MADNTTLDSGAGGDTIATDDIAGVKFPRGKIVIGADGVNDGDVSSANPLPVAGTGTAGTANAGVMTVQGVASMTPVQVGDNSGSLTVDAPVGTPVFVRLSDGSAAIATLPVSLASVPSHAVTNAGTFAVQVDGSALTSLQLIDDTVATTGAAITAKGLAACGTDGTDARVLKTDTNGELQVDVLTMPTVTVTGTVTASASVAQDDLVLVWASNQTTTGTTFPALAQTTTAPTGDGVITMTGRENVALIPFGRNGNNLTLKMRVSGWRIIGTEYIATTLAEITCTLSSSLTGRAGGTPSNSDLYCDTITVDKGIAVVLASPADDTGIASVEIPVGPYDLIQVQGIRNGSATEFNALRQTY